MANNKLINIFDPNVDEISQGFTINSWHVSQSVEAFNAVAPYDIAISGSLTVTGSTSVSEFSGSIFTPELPSTTSQFEVVVIDTTTNELKKTSIVVL